MIAEALVAARYSALLRMLEKERDLIPAGPPDALRSIIATRKAAMTELLEPGASLPRGFVLVLEARVARNDKLMRKREGQGDGENTTGE